MQFSGTVVHGFAVYLGQQTKGSLQCESQIRPVPDRPSVCVGVRGDGCATCRDTTVRPLHGGTKIKRQEVWEERSPRRFVYEDAWRKDESYEPVVMDAWEKNRGAFSLADVNASLNYMQVQLTDWKQKKFGDIRRKLKKVCREFELEKANSLYKGSSRRGKDLARHLSDLLLQEEIMAQQRSRADWLHIEAL